MDAPPKGFAAMSPEKRHEIAARGGAKVPNDKRSFSADRTLAAAAGRTGGLNTPPGKRSFSTNRDLASEAGRKGGKARKASRRDEK